MSKRVKKTTSGREALGNALKRGEVEAVFISEGTETPPEVAEAVVEHGVPVHVVRSSGE